MERGRPKGSLSGKYKDSMGNPIGVYDWRKNNPSLRYKLDRSYNLRRIKFILEKILKYKTELDNLFLQLKKIDSNRLEEIKNLKNQFDKIYQDLNLKEKSIKIEEEIKPIPKIKNIFKKLRP